jgi:hypothetical protein
MSTATMSTDILSFDIMSHSSEIDAYVACLLRRILMTFSIQMSLRSQCYKSIP